MSNVTFLLHVFVRPVNCCDLNGVVALLIHCNFFRDAFVREKWILFEFLKTLSKDERENGVFTNSIEKPLLMSSFSTTSIDAKFSRIRVSCSARLSARMGWFNKVVTQKLGIYEKAYNVCHVCSDQTWAIAFALFSYIGVLSLLNLISTCTISSADLLCISSKSFWTS